MRVTMVRIMKDSTTSNEWWQTDHWLGKRMGGMPITPEIEEIYRRAAKLTIAQLRELTSLVGIVLISDNKNDYILTLDEADDLDRVREFLSEHGV